MVKCLSSSSTMSERKGKKRKARIIISTSTFDSTPSAPCEGGRGGKLFEGRKEGKREDELLQHSLSFPLSPSLSCRREGGGKKRGGGRGVEKHGCLHHLFPHPLGRGEGEKNIWRGGKGNGIAQDYFLSLQSLPLGKEGGFSAPLSLAPFLLWVLTEMEELLRGEEKMPSAIEPSSAAMVKRKEMGGKKKEEGGGARRNASFFSLSPASPGPSIGKKREKKGDEERKKKRNLRTSCVRLSHYTGRSEKKEKKRSERKRIADGMGFYNSAKFVAAIRKERKRGAKKKGKGRGESESRPSRPNISSLFHHPCQQVSSIRKGKRKRKVAKEKRERENVGGGDSASFPPSLLHSLSFTNLPPS